MSLRGERVKLVPVAAEHAGELFAAGHGGDPALWEYLPYGPFSDVEEIGRASCRERVLDHV